MLEQFLKFIHFPYGKITTSLPIPTVSDVEPPYETVNLIMILFFLPYLLLGSFR